MISKEEFLRREAIRISNRQLSDKFFTMLQGKADEFNIPVSVLYSIALIETSKRRILFRIIEKFIFLCFHAMNIRVSMTLGAFQYTYNTLDTEEYWVDEKTVLSDASALIACLLARNKSLIDVGKEYNGSLDYGVVLEQVHQRLVEAKHV